MQKISEPKLHCNSKSGRENAKGKGEQDSYALSLGWLANSCVYL